MLILGRQIRASLNILHTQMQCLEDREANSEWRKDLKGLSMDMKSELGLRESQIFNRRI